MKRTAIAMAAIVAVALAGWYASAGDGGAGQRRAAAHDKRAGPGVAAGAPALPAASSLGSAGQPAAGAEGGDGLRRVPIPAVDTRTPAWLPLAQAREAGDSRTPPIQRDGPAEQPDPGLLADREAYAAYQLAQKQRLAAAYAQAAGPELARLQADLEQGREAGIPPQELARVAEKIRRIEQQRQAANAMLSK